VLYGYALRRVRDAHAAEDLVQETLLAAITSAGDYAGRSLERTWLIGILKHKLVDHLRRSLRQKPLSDMSSGISPDVFDERGNWKVRVSSWPATPGATAENAEFRRVLASCLSKLPPRTAHVFWLHEAEATASTDLCKDLGISATNLWTMLHRARVGLQRCLSVNWFESGEP
jgi:RNA polymerase sigma-70 factor (ECF subfamily)